MAIQTKHITLGKRNQITLPKEFVPENTTLFECEQREDGSIVLTPQIAIPAHQAYFWTLQWQKGEKAASKDIREERLTQFKNSKEMFKELSKRRKK